MSERAETAESVFRDHADDAEALQRFRTLVNAVDDGIYQLDSDGRFVAVNDVVVEITGYERERLVGEHVSVLLDGKTVRTFERRIERRLQDGPENGASSDRTETFEFAVRTADGGRVPCELRFGLLVDDGTFRGSVGVVRTVSERERGERALDCSRERERELERYEAIVEAVDDGMYVVDEDGRFTMVNEAYAELIGYSRGELLGEHVSLVVDADVRHRVEARLRDGETDRSVITAELETKSGERVPAEATFALLPDAADEHRVGVVRDVTERRERERKLAESERRYRTLAEHFPNGAVSVYDHDLRYELAQGGKIGEELPSRDRLVGDRMPEIFPDDTVADLEPVFRAAVEDGETGSTTTEFGGRTWRLWATPLRDADGEIFAGLAFTQDITEQVERERKLEETVEKLEESNERLESFASMLAHELRNPVAIGQIYSQQLPDRTDDEAVEYVTEAFDRIEDMIDVMLVLARGRKAVGERTSLSISEVAREAWDGLDTPGATLEVDVEAVLQADETYVRHLFRNLFENSVEHGSTGPRSHAHEDSVEHDDHDVTVRVGELTDGFYVADDGEGIPPDHWDDVFETGFTTAGDEGGTGLGLAFVEKLAEVYGWTVSVHESESGGARFEFRNVTLDPPEEGG